MEERLLKMDKYFEAGTSKKHQRSELMINNSNTSALNMKTTTRTKSVNESISDRPKKICLKKRAHTSMAEFQTEYQINGIKKHPVSMAKDVNSLKDNGEKSHQFEKDHKLDAQEEEWDKKMKRKRSIGTILSKPIDNDGGMFKRGAVNEMDNNQKPAFGQWAGQRPPKVPRTKRSNIVSEDDYSSSPSKTPRNVTNGSLKITVKLDKRQFRMKDSVGGERERKGKMGINEADGVQVRSPRGVLIKRCDNAGSPKLLQKNDSKSGHRLKRLSEYKGLSNDAPLQYSSPSRFSGESDDDKEELQSPANHARIPTPSSSPLWKKKKEPMFAPITSEEKSLLSQKVATHTPRQQPNTFSKKHETNHTTSPFYKRLLSALIIEDGDDMDELLEVDINSFSVSTSETYYHLNDRDPRKKARVENNSIHGQSLGLTKKHKSVFTSCEDVNSDGIEYEKMCVDDRLLLELQYIGLCMDSMPDLEDNEDEFIPHEVDNLQTAAFHQQDTGRSPRPEVPEVPKQVARSHNSSKNCFNEYSLRDILSVPIQTKPQKHTVSVDFPVDSHPSPKLLKDGAFGVSNRGKNKSMLLNNVGTTISSGTKKRKRSNRATTKQPPNAPTQNTEAKFVNKPKPTEPSPLLPLPHIVNETSQFVDRTTEGNDKSNPVTEAVEEVDPMDELGGTGGPHDLDSLLSFNEEGLDEDFEAGLAVPDDDLFSIF